MILWYEYFLKHTLYKNEIRIKLQISINNINMSHVAKLSAITDNPCMKSRINTGHAHTNI